ncbi:MAG TPA: hypothetical protein VLA11_08175 [Woeseiaceae bacterium]|jgi:hypothetical protein|nr:hypothetical protein [Woeseiaceae bacterium]
MTNRLLTLVVPVLLVALLLPCQGLSDTGQTAAEQRLSDDLRSLPVPEDARFNDLLTYDYAMMMVSGAPTDDPQVIFPALRILLFAVPRSCSSLESFYQQHWEGFEFFVEERFGDTNYVTFLDWLGDELRQTQADSIDEIDDTAEGISIFASNTPPRSPDSPGADLMREQWGFPSDIGYCLVIMINSRKVDLADIPLSIRGLHAGDVYSSVSGLFNVIVPSADNFFVNRYAVLEASEREGTSFAEDVSFIIGDFGELYRTGVVRLDQELTGEVEPAAGVSTLDALARMPLTRHFQGQLPGEIELIDSEEFGTEYGTAIKALFRIENGSQLIQITDLESPEMSARNDALVAAAVAQVGDFLVFATAQNDFLASEGNEDALVKSIQAKAVSLFDLLTWSRNLPGDAGLPATVMMPSKVPHVEHCARNFPTEEGVAFENMCEERIALQILLDQDKGDVGRDFIEPGETRRFTDADGQYAFAVCPSGYEAGKDFDRENLPSILASQYNCVRREADAS